MTRVDSRTPETTKRGDRGGGALGLLLAVVVMGVAGVIVVRSLPGTGVGNIPALPGVSSTKASGGPRGVPSTRASGVQADIRAAAVVACKTDFLAVEAAVSYYEAEKGKFPSSLRSVRSWLRDPVQSPYFSISLDSRRPGVVEVGTRGHPLGPGAANCAFAG